MKKFKGTLQKFNDNLWYFYIDIPDEIAHHFLADEGNRRVVVTYNDSKEVQCALFPKGDNHWFLNLGKEVRKMTQLNVGDEVAVTIKKDESEYGFSMPEELAELFAIDDEGKAAFDKLTPGKKRSLLHIIGKPKTSQTRVKKAIITIDYLKATNGRLDYTELQEAFRNRNDEF